MASVRLSNISKKFGDFVAVKDIDLTINDGEFFSLLGPSGCGKTTILRMIAGFYIPTTGSIFFDDRDVSYLPVNKRNTAMVFQNYALFPHMTVSENVAFGLQARKTPKTEIKERVGKALELVDLSGKENRPVTQLSGGQQQRVALARAIVIEPEILLLDEPLSNLDAKLRRETREQIQKLQSELKITTIYVTHDQEEALTLSDRLILLNEGTCQQIGTPYQIYNQPSNAFIARFIGRSNLLNGIITDIKDNEILIKVNDNIHLSSAKIENHYSIGQNVILAIKPESIILSRDEKTEVNMIKGEIKAKRFNGYLIEYEVEATGLLLNILSLSDNNEKYEVSDVVCMRIPEDKIGMITF
jgi:iron(III) transport system ATP-binding protein